MMQLYKEVKGRELIDMVAIRGNIWLLGKKWQLLHLTDKHTYRFLKKMKFKQQ